MRARSVAAADPGQSGNSAASVRRRLSLRSRLILLVVAGVIPLLAFILVFQYVVYLKDVETTGLQTLALARSMSLLVDQALQTPIAALQALALSSSLATGDLRAFRGRAEAIIPQQFPSANIVLLRRDGQEILNTRLPFGAPLPVRPDMESTDTVFATGRPAVSNLYWSAVGSRWVVAIDVPVEGADGKIIYVLSLNPDLDAFTDVIRRQRIPSTWMTSVLDRSGVIVARIPNAPRYVGQKGAPSFQAHLQIEREGISENLSREGVPVLTAFSHADRFGWAVGIGVPRAELTGPALWGTMRILGAGGLLFGAGLVLALLAARRIAGPIEQLRRLAATTDRDTPLDLAPTGLRDVDEVAQALVAAARSRQRSREAEAVLRDGIDTIPEGFVIYDAHDRLVMCNDSYRQLFPGVIDQTVPGSLFADLLRARLARGNFPMAKDLEAGWLAERVRELHDFGDGVEHLLAGGRWILARNRRLSNGWIAGLRVDITAHKVAEQALAKSEERFRLVVEAFPTAIVTVGAYGIIELVNVQAETLFGYPRAALLGQSIQILLADHPRAGDVERQGRRQDGEEFPIEIGMIPMESADGVKTLVSVTDMTASWQAERIQSYYAAIVESSADAIIAKDLGGVVTSWNKAAEMMFGWTAAEMIGQPILRLLPADRLDEEAVILAQIHRGERINHYETVRCRKDGVHFPVSLTISPIRGPGGDIIGASKIVRDITEQIRLRENLRVSEDRFRSIFSAVGEGIFILSPTDGSFTEINATGCVMFGYTSEELLGSDLQTLSSGTEPYTGREAAGWIERAAVSGEPQRFGWHCRAKDGHLFWAEISMRSALISGQQAVLAIVRDVTERLSVEAQLRQAQKMEAISNLSGGMAHDFNNMLGVIIGSLDLVGPLIKDSHHVTELVEEAINAALSSAELISRLLAFARKQSLRNERISLNDLISGIVRLLRRTLGENIEIILDLADDLWPVIADAAQLEASLTNLANNARDVMPNGGRLAIATLNRCLDADYAAANLEAKAGDYATIEVSDTGTGMTPEVMRQIFEPFYTTKDPGKGTGLGLSMVFGFIKQSGGHINVYSVPGVGTTFRLFLPRAAGETPLGRPPVGPTPLMRGAGETVLAVEDNPKLREVVMRQLDALGYQAISADGPATALAILERQKIDLLFTDVIMPGPLDGIALTHQVIARWPTVKVLLTSGFAARTFDDVLDSQGLAVRLISKPYRVEELAKVLRQVLDH